MAQTIYAQNLDGMGTGTGARIGVNWDAMDAATEKYIDEYLQNIEDEIRKPGVNDVRPYQLSGYGCGLRNTGNGKEDSGRPGGDGDAGQIAVARWAFGSVAEKVLREGDRPILLVKKETENRLQ